MPQQVPHSALLPLPAQSEHTSKGVFILRTQEIGPCGREQKSTEPRAADTCTVCPQFPPHCGLSRAAPARGTHTRTSARGTPTRGAGSHPSSRGNKMYLTQTWDRKLPALLKPPRLLLSKRYVRFCMDRWGLVTRTWSRAGQLEGASYLRKKPRGQLKLKMQNQ